MFLDTHAAVALHDGKLEVFGRTSRRLLHSASLRWSPAVAVELALLHEIGRVTVPPERMLGTLARRPARSRQTTRSRPSRRAPSTSRGHATRSTA